MSDAKMQAAVGNAQSALPHNPDTGPALVRITFTDGNGKALGNPIEIRVPRELSKKLVKMYLLEMMIKLIKSGMDVLVSGLGW